LLCACAELRLEGLVRFDAPLLRVLLLLDDRLLAARGFGLLDERLLCERELERGFAVERPLDELRAFVDELRVFERPLVELRLDALFVLRPEAFLVLRREPPLVCWAISSSSGGAVESAARIPAISDGTRAWAAYTRFRR
jgi:hypothetical protein